MATIERIYAFDPGATTGYTMFDVSSKKFMHTSELVSIEDHVEAFRLIEDYVYHLHTVAIVVEDFHLFAWKAKDLVNNGFPAVRRIGIIEVLAHLQGLKIILQQPSIKTQFSDKQILACIDIIGVLPRSLHIRDAMRHALYYYYDKVAHGYPTAAPK